MSWSSEQDQFKKACGQCHENPVKNLFNQVDQITKAKGLGIAAGWNRTLIIKFLLEAGINPNINDSNGIPILFRMARHGNMEMIELYLKKGGNLNIVDQDKQNALHWCALNGELETCKYLVLLGIDYKATDKCGKTPRDLAEQQNQFKIVEFLHEVENENQKIEFDKANSIIPNDFVRDLGVKQSEIVEGIRLGGGSSGDVFRGIWKGLEVAIKRLKISTMSDSNENFKKEAKLMFQFRHPHIVQLLGFVSEEPYMLIMEFLEKGNLADYLKLTNPNHNNNNNNNNLPLLDWNKKKEITLQIAQGMLYLHDKGALHRDLKSLNILLTKHLDVKISDFGLSTLKEGSKDSTKTSSVHAFGTFVWMAPELLNSKKNSKESDVYSFGVVCFEISTHQFPWIGKDPFQIVFALSQGQREEIPAETPLEYSKLIESCWNQIPSARPAFGTIVENINKMISETGKPQDKHSGIISNCLDKPKTKTVESAKPSETPLENTTNSQDYFGASDYAKKSPQEALITNTMN